MEQRHRGLIFAISVLAFLVLMIPTFRNPHKIPVSLSGHCTLNVLADRATISLRVSSEGSKQSRVTQDVRQTTDDILSLLRPLTLPPNRTTTLTSVTIDTPSVPSDFLPPLATLSVNTFSSSSYVYDRPILGEGKTYTSSITITAEFRTLHKFSADPYLNQSRTVIPASGFHHLSLVLPSLAKMPRTKIDHLKWHLTPDHLASLQSQARHNAMSEALQKAADYTAPMHLRFPSIRCVKFTEEQRRKPREHYRDVYDAVRMQRDELMYSRAPSYQYELDEGDYGYEIEEQKHEAFGLEPQSIEVGSDVHGDFVVVERGLLRSVLDLLV